METTDQTNGGAEAAKVIPIGYAQDLRQNREKHPKPQVPERLYTVNFISSKRGSELLRRYRDRVRQHHMNRLYSPGKPTHQEPDVSTTDRYIDARLAGIEKTLDARMEAMQRFQEQADARQDRARQESDARFEKAEERFDSRVGEVLQEMRETRRHVSVMSATTIGVTVGSVIAALAVAVTLMASQINEQGAWLRDSVNRIEQRVEPRSGPTSPTQRDAAPPAAAE